MFWNQYIVSWPQSVNWIHMKHIVYNIPSRMYESCLCKFVLQCWTRNEVSVRFYEISRFKFVPILQKLNRCLFIQGRYSQHILIYDLVWIFFCKKFECRSIRFESFLLQIVSTFIRLLNPHLSTTKHSLLSSNHNFRCD